MAALDDAIEACLTAPPFSLPDAAKTALLRPALQQLTQYHASACPAYGRILSARGGVPTIDALEQLPALPARLFKEVMLVSMPPGRIIRRLKSSGTSGQRPSIIALDEVTTRLQSRALIATTRQMLGAARLPMLIVDAPATAAGGGDHSARAAGILGFSLFGASQTHALTDDMCVDIPAIKAFAAAVGDKPCLVFGFTFIVWRRLVRELRRHGLSFRLPGGVLIHGGGWKAMAHEAVSAADFSAGVRESLGLSRIHEYYGFVEQVGTLFWGCEAGRLHAPSAAEVIIRDPISGRARSIGEPGLVQALSVVPRSYPGQSILTEDLGVWLGTDDCPCGRLGRTFHVLGRLPRAELRGCSDTFAIPQSGNP